MRTIARGNTPESCQKRVNLLKRDGWTPITEVKLDPSPTIDVSWVCVLERKSRENESPNARKWGRERWLW